MTGWVWAGATDDDFDRTKIMAWISVAQALGFVVGPALGFLLAALLKDAAFPIVPGNPDFM
jgi:MFS family permease